MGTCSVTWSENLSKKMMKGLAEGRDSATQLQTLLRKPFGQHVSVSAEELAEKILTSFDETISLLTINSTSASASGISDDHGANLNGGDVISNHEISPEPLDHHSHCDDRSSEGNSGESTKKRSPPVFKDRRGCYKRRKSSQSWTITRATIEDGQAWRKYGQKEILNAEYPRAYFRCTRKHEQGCRATKQVQQIQDNPKMYQTTYIGQHTCKHILKAPQMIIDDNSEPYNLVNNNNYKASTTIDFDQHHSRNKTSSTTIGNIVHDNDNKYAKSDAPTLMELEEVQEQVLMIKEEEQISEDSSDKSSFENEDLWSDFKDIELSDPSMGLLSPNNRRAGTDNDQDAVDSISFSFVDRIGADMIDDFVVKSIDFGDFDEAEFRLGSM